MHVLCISTMSKVCMSTVRRNESNSVYNFTSPFLFVLSKGCLFFIYHMSLQWVVYNTTLPCVRALGLVRCHTLSASPFQVISFLCALLYSTYSLGFCCFFFIYIVFSLLLSYLNQSSVQSEKRKSDEGSKYIPYLTPMYLTFTLILMLIKPFSLTVSLSFTHSLSLSLTFSHSHSVLKHIFFIINNSHHLYSFIIMT